MGFIPGVLEGFHVATTSRVWAMAENSHILLIHQQTNSQSCRVADVIWISNGYLHFAGALSSVPAGLLLR
ncbi:hypothetical protein [Oleiagrimonas sp.]|jgi:hypothetical protein|uniref:hypothetical protein n=1 Tax=Oleiagrimonas sp. TaxID=2010330 RepID=UPI002607DF85|nr:hypothetical protein [Oleiagrimonas sp.]MDA3913357.1 hypothetical protein [Oleiagrimonas sp.]